MRRAFTLIELLVVVAIIALLIAILLPSLGKAREQARKTICGTQLKGQGASLAIYAAQNNDQLPMGPGFDDSINTATWMHDETVGFSDAILNIQTTVNMNAASVRKWFYCPSNLEYNLDAYWQPTGPAGTNRRLGYTYLNYRGIPPTPSLSSSVLPTPRISPPIEWRKKWSSVPMASRTELITDLIMNELPPSSILIDYTSKLASTGTYVNSVSHMGGKKPAGANDLFHDGHVEWLPWKSTSKIHFIQCGGGPSGTTYFMLIDP